MQLIENFTLEDIMDEETNILKNYYTVDNFIETLLARWSFILDRNRDYFTKEKKISIALNLEKCYRHLLDDKVIEPNSLQSLFDILTING